MTEIRLHQPVEIDRPVDEVWAVVADYRLDPRWRSGVVTMAPSTPGHVAPGTTTAETIRVAGRTFHNDGVVTHVDPGRRFTWRTTRGAAAHGARHVTGLADGRTRVDLHLVVTPHGADRLLRPLLAAMLGRTLRGDALRLRRLVEQGATGVPGPARGALSTGSRR